MIDFKKNISFDKVFLFFVLVCFSSIISSFFSLDHISYIALFYRYSMSGWANFLQEARSFEAFFLFLSKLMPGEPSMTSFYLYMLIVSFLSLGLKYYLILKESKNFYISIIFYFSYFFVLLDCTQVRASLAISIAYLGGYFYSKDRVLIYFFLVSLSAFFFHYSMVFFVLTVFFRVRSISLFFIVFWLLSIFLWFFDFSFVFLLKEGLANFDGSNIVGLEKFYSYIGEKSIDSKPYSFQLLGLFFLSLYVFYKKNSTLSNFEIFCFNCVFCSFFIVAFFAGSPVIQNRVSEIFRFALVFLLPLYYDVFSERVICKKIAFVVFFTISALYFYFYTILPGLIEFGVY